MIRNLSIAAFFILTANCLVAQENVTWYSITEAIELNREEPRMLVIDVYTDWCGWCKRMDTNTFNNPVIVDYLNKFFYPVKLNAEGKEDITIGNRTYRFIDNGSRGYHELAAVILQGRMAYPSVAFLNPNMNIIQVVPGYQTAFQFEKYLAYFRD
ncbi:MAG TPA: DUF255 domain-containing protein, partial [Bacteroidaceae bacterium]|nr:DUF255 domain-containing protein [Bacteroidaceae bacterium]